MMMQSSSKKWKLLELVQVSQELLGGDTVPPMQLLKAYGSAPSPQAVEAESATTTEASALWFISGICGPAKSDTAITGLLERAIAKGSFVPGPDVYFTQLANPASRGSKDKKSSKVASSTIQAAVTSVFDEEPALEVRTLVRWAEKMRPRAIVTFSMGNGVIRHSRPNTLNQDVLDKLAKLSERPLCSFGNEPTLEDGKTFTSHKIFTDLLEWAASQNVLVIDFTIDHSRKAFKDITDLDWRPSVGPALKWLVEGFRFNPPKEEPAPIMHKVVPALELPPEFANL